jgi:hypothetical protein
VRDQIGLTPKLYCRVHRFRRVVREIASAGAWTGGRRARRHLHHVVMD